MKLKAYQNCIELILQTKPIIEAIVERIRISHNKETEKTLEKGTHNGKNSDIKTNNSEENKELEDEENLVILLEQRLQFALRSLTKLYLGKNSGNQKKE